MKNFINFSADQFSVDSCQWVISHRWWVIASVLLFTAVLSTQIRSLDFATDYRVFFSGENPDLIAFEDFQKIYTKSDNILIVVRAKDQRKFDGEMSQVVEKITEAAWKIPFSTRVDSITNYQHTTAQEDDLVVADLIQQGQQLRAEVLDERVDIALQEPLLHNFLIAKDAKTTAINVILQYPGKDLSETPISVNYARDLVRNIQQQHPEMTIVLTGVAMMNAAFSEASIKDLTTLTPLMYLMLALITFFTLRSWSMTISTLIVVMLSTVIALGAGGLMKILLTPISLSAPTIVLTLAIADSIHILITLRGLMQKGMDKHSALIEAVRINFMAVSITSLTTIIGFLALNFSDSPPFNHLGNMTAVGIAAAWALSLFLLPALISCLPLKVNKSTSTQSQSSFFIRLADFVVERPQKILFVMGSITLVLSSLAFSNQLNDQWTKYFDRSIQFRNDTDYAIQYLGGFYPIEFSINAAQTGGISDPDYLHKLDEFVNWLRAHPNVEHVFSLTDIMKRLNKNMHADNNDYYRLPEEHDLSAQYLLLYELSLPYGLDLNDRINIDKSSTRVTATLGDVDTIQTRAFMRDAENWLRENAPEYMWAKPTGATQMFSYISKRNIESMLKGNVIAVSLIALILIIALRSWRLGLLSIIPNATPVLVTLGIWSLTVGTVGMPVAIITVTSLGIVVDDTVHLLSKYLRARREQGLDLNNSIRYSLDTIGRAVTINTAILAGGFCILAMSSFKVNMETGVLTAIAVIVALVLDFLLLPALLCVLDKRTHKSADQQSSPERII